MIAPDGTQSGIAGVSAYGSDVVENGCAECSFSSVTLSVWKTSSAITDASAAKAVVDASAATVIIHADKQYQQSLDPGTYLVCDQSSCAAIEVFAGHVTTVNVIAVYGPTGFMIAEPGDSAVHAATSFDVSG